MLCSCCNVSYHHIAILRWAKWYVQSTSMTTIVTLLYIKKLFEIYDTASCKNAYCSLEMKVGLYQFG